MSNHAQDAATPVTADVQAALDMPATSGKKRRRRGQSRSARRARQIKRLQEENEMLHRRLAAIYDALTLD